LYDIKITRDDEYKINSMSRFKYFHTRLESSTFILTEYFYNIAKKKEKKKIMIIHQDLLDRCEAGNHPFRYFSLSSSRVIFMSYNGNLKHAAEHMCNKGLKAVFSLKSKILDFEFSSIKLKSKLFDTLCKSPISHLDAKFEAFLCTPSKYLQNLL
jgi:hypothetical protein